MNDMPNAGQEPQSPPPGQPGPNLWRDASNAAKNVADWLRPPPEVGAHFRAARVEVLKAVRALIDHRIDKLSRTDQHGTKITVE
jgi:hypothetical protein